MARGGVLKEEITNKILEVFPGSFRYDKELRIPGKENGELIQIKVTLTAAKTNVNDGTMSNETVAAINNEIPEPTAEEKEKVVKLLDRLGLTND